MSESDISAIITAETGDFTGPILEASQASESFWSSLVDNGGRALSTMGNMLAQLAGDIASETKSVLLEVGHDLGVIAAETAIAGAAATSAGSYFLGFWNTMRLGLTAASWFVPWLKVVSIALTAATVSVWAYQKADEYLNGELTKSIVHVERTSESFENLKATLSESAEVFGIVGDGAGSLGSQFVQMALDYSGISKALEGLDIVVSSSLDALSGIVEFHNASFRNLTDTVSDYLSTSGASAQQLRDMAKATEELIAKQESQGDLFKQIRAMQDEAADSAAHHAEIQKISSLTNIASVEAEILKLQERATAAVIAGEADENWMKKSAALFAALENQKSAIASGKMDQPQQSSAGGSAIAAAEQALRTLSIGRDEAAVSALIAANATAEEVDTLRELQAEIAAVTSAKNAEREAERAATEAAENASRVREQGESRITSMSDQLDLLSGAATNAEIAMRQAARQGFDEDQVKRIGEMTAEMDALRESQDQPVAKANRPQALKAAFAGSQEAASILLRGVGGGGKSIEQIAQKQLAVQQQTLMAVKANKPQELQFINV